MNIEASTRLLLNQLNQTSPIKTATEGDSFTNIFGNAINQLTETQIHADQATQALAMGEDIQLHDVMIQSTEAQLSLELAVQVRNRCLEAYNEVKNMQF
ncbi:flagellar hook-basal body complex protein FliE [Jeotgalibaca dankookensis]|uniref:flagellar hook-basal body complex protein FliE n=1 Tax=Jeotgalibaca dankookensis TaxID=708126 RepID=UPI00078270FC|nr:flagellar hook-basal body complex protein FliE [Jeotgalibaca dankookensis]